MKSLFLRCFLSLSAGLMPAFLVPSLVTPAHAQQPQTVPMPSELELAKLIWTTMAAVDHANMSGNYSVLRDLAAPGFQMNNDAARLTQIFSSLRGSGTDLSNTLLLAPTYRVAPRMEQPGLLRLQGFFGLRPTAINFDLYFQWINARWRLFGVAISPTTLATEVPGPARQPQAQPPQPGPRKK